MLKAFILSALCGELTSAYNASIEGCEAFAALWKGNCGGTDKDSVYDSATDWETSGAGATIINCSTRLNDDGTKIETKQPYTGSLGSAYTLFARNCVTCRQDKLSDPVYIRYQSNNIPKFCFGSPVTEQNYPTIGRFDVELKWNPDVTGKLNVAEKEAADKATTKSLLCADSSSIVLPPTSELEDHSKTAIESVVGWSMQNVKINYAVIEVDESSKDALETYSPVMDFCLTSSDTDN